MNKKDMKNIYILILILFIPILISADGGMIIWPPEIELDQSAQNAIVAWDGKKEILILSVDIESSSNVTALRIIPLPSNPSEIKEGSFESFESLVEIMNSKLDTGNQEYLDDEKTAAPESEQGIEITFQQEIGAHDITVVKVNNLDYFLNWIEDFAQDKNFEQKEISPEFKQGIKNYFKRDIKYFVFDVINSGETKESLKPLIYRFDSDFFYFPILISGISEIGQSEAEISLFLITEKDVSIPYPPYDYYSYDWFGDYTIELNKEEIDQVSEDIGELFDSGVLVRKLYIYNRLIELRNDLIIFPSYLWNKNLRLGSEGEEVKALQQILINDGFWESEIGATGYFGPVTKNALIKFQEEYKWDILYPVDLEKGTGYFGSQTRNYLEKISLPINQSIVVEKVSFERNLSIGMSGDDVKALQKILIREGVWERPDIEATGYFGLITKQAVIKYQEKYTSEILEPLGLTKGTGFVGPSTRTLLEK